MSNYKIKKYTRDQATKYGVQVKPSTNPSKKIDVFQNGKKISSVGSSGYFDYPSWIEKEGLSYARERRKLYKARHEKDRHVKGSAGWWADKLLW